MKTKNAVSFDELNLIPELLQPIKRKGYATPTPVQTKTIPHILDGADIFASAQTGTGKTAAFALPILQILHKKNSSIKKKRSAPQALILTPTRELAMQVAECFKTYGKKLSLRSHVIYGGVGIHPQIKKLRQGVEILIATPGRLLDHLRQGSLNLSHIDMFVLDEADRMLDMGFLPDITKIVEELPNSRQNLMFSATYSGDVKKCSAKILKHPQIVEVAERNAMADQVTQIIHPVEQSRKRELLSKLILEGNWFQILVFTRTKRRADLLAKQLKQDGIKSAAIHSSKSQNQRTRTLVEFKKAKIQALVATDIAARGLDITDLPHVVNFDLPDAPEDYIHRIGRTGRAGLTGEAITLVSPEEKKKLLAIEKVIRKKLPQKIIEEFRPPKREQNKNSKNLKPRKKQTTQKNKPSKKKSNQTTSHKSSGKGTNKTRQRKSSRPSTKRSATKNRKRRRI